MSEAVPKIEGHAAFYTHLKSGHVDKARIIGLENDRFVEKILVGRKYWEAPIITSRICGICPTIHNVTATRAIEAACDIEPSSQTVELRKLMLSAQMVQSHSLHLYLLVLPDFVGVSSSFELQKSHPDIFQNAVILKKYADKIMEIVGGRAVHPIASVPGGFKAVPKVTELEKLLAESAEVLQTAEKTLRLFANFTYPKLTKKIIYSALYDKNEYAFYDGDIQTTSDVTFKPSEYTKYIKEELKDYTRAKFGTFKGKEMMVGAAARINLSGDKLHPKAQALMAELAIKTPFDNPFDNTIAQAIENYHFVLTSQELIKHFVANKPKSEQLVSPKHFGTGTGACEAPRGTLFHHYELDKGGFIAKCDIITPTVQTLFSMEADMKRLEKILVKLKGDERTQMIEMLIRAYDPCITCATH